MHLASTRRTAARPDEAPSGVDAGAVRFSIGLEDAEGLIMDVTRALDAVRAATRA
ncbi:hypothetical protein Misp02_67000 [Microtetraspora sp. NBRC 16547]|nr:hypothetical protein Misp02_67000 [Microtetraspora sp. NBRC 16547]